MSSLNSIFVWIVPLFLAIFGIVGNLFGFIIFSRKSLVKFPARNIYRALAIMDTFYLIHVKFQFYLYYNGLSIRLLSDFSCKIVRYLNYSLAPISAWLLVYLSIYKFITIKFSHLTKRINRVQSLTILMIIGYNLVIYLPVLIYVEIIEYHDEDHEQENATLNQSTGNYECSFSKTNIENIFSVMDLLNLTILPFAFMLTFSILLISTIMKSRLRISRLSSTTDRNKLKRDIKFVFSCVLLNFIFIMLNLPISLANLAFESVQSYYDAILCIYYTSYCINFYILFLFNSIFRKQVILFKI